MTDFTTAASYEEYLEGRSFLPEGFSSSVVSLTFFPKEKKSDMPYNMNLAAIVLNEPSSSFAGVFTRNKAPGAPIVIAKKMIGREFCRGVLINNRIANVCAPAGEEAALDIVDAFRGAAGWKGKGSDEAVLFPMSTGIIGWELPRQEMKEAAVRLAHGLAAGGSEAGRSILPVAKGIMTTDAFPKVRSAECGGGRITATAKGAGMIEPNMATLLVFITTDIHLSREAVRRILPRVIDKTFNLISVDSDQSTSDAALLFSSCKVDGIGEEEFEDTLLTVCAALAEDIVRNGEGTNHVIRVKVTGAEDEESAEGFGKAVVNSPLVKAAMYGNDPNLGRIIMALGDYAGNGGKDFETGRTEIHIGGIQVFSRGAFLLDEEKEVKLNSYLKKCGLGDQKLGFPLHSRNVEISVDLGCGCGEAAVLGSDLSYEYVRENADYRT